MSDHHLSLFIISNHQSPLNHQSLQVTIKPSVIINYIRLSITISYHQLSSVTNKQSVIISHHRTHQTISHHQAITYCLSSSVTIKPSVISDHQSPQITIRTSVIISHFNGHCCLIRSHCCCLSYSLEVLTLVNCFCSLFSPPHFFWV